MSGWITTGLVVFVALCAARAGYAYACWRIGVFMGTGWHHLSRINKFRPVDSDDLNDAFGVERWEQFRAFQAVADHQKRQRVIKGQ